MERISALSIQYHAGAAGMLDEALTSQYFSPKYALSFDYPEAWFVDDSPFYVPFPEYEGLRDRRMGPFLRFPSDENLNVVIRWQPIATTDEAGFMCASQTVMERSRAEVESEPDSESHQGLGFESFSVSGVKPIS